MVGVIPLNLTGINLIHGNRSSKKYANFDKASLLQDLKENGDWMKPVFSAVLDYNKLYTIYTSKIGNVQRPWC